MLPLKDIIIESVQYRFRPMVKMLASGAEDGTIRLWDVETGTIIASFRHTRLRLFYPDPVTSVLFSPDGKILASGAEDRTVKLWDVATIASIASGVGNTGVVSSVSFSPIAILEDTAWAKSVSFSPDGKMLASVAGDWTVKLWDIATIVAIASRLGDTGVVSSVSFSPIAILKHTAFVHSVSFSSNGKILASGTADKTVKLWDIATATIIATLEGHTLTVRSVSFSPDGKMLASGANDRTVKLWDVETGTNIATLEGHTHFIWSVSFSPDGKMLASGAGDDTVMLWDMSPYITSQSPTSDFDGDGTVGFNDFLEFVAQFGLSQGDEGYEARFDLDGDGMIGFNDFLIFVNDFGKKSS